MGFREDFWILKYIFQPAILKVADDLHLHIIML